jgi:endogenous inhibitor of DNA gyrase (YacG/DUF329 family)
MFAFFEKIRLYLENTVNNPYIKSNCVYCGKQVIARKKTVEKYKVYCRQKCINKHANLNT